LYRYVEVLSDDKQRREYDATGRAAGDDGANGGASNPHGAKFNFAGGNNGPPHGGADEWMFRFDKRDVGADGVAKGKWVHKSTGEAAEGERDVAGERRKNPCRRKHACVGGAGGVPTPGWGCVQVEFSSPIA
jgi:DnaJ-class molecular chaperone